MFDKVVFEVKEEHVKLLRRACVEWHGCEFGAPAINCRRPYGNSNVLGDIAEILEIPSTNDDYPVFSDEQEKAMEKLHKETETALQIFLATGEMKAGLYECEKYMNNWKLKGE